MLVSSNWTLVSFKHLYETVLEVAYLCTQRKRSTHMICCFRCNKTVDVACRQYGETNTNIFPKQKTTAYKFWTDDVYRGSKRIPEILGDSGSSSRRLFRLSSHIEVEQHKKRMYKHIDQDQINAKFPRTKTNF